MNMFIALCVKEINVPKALEASLKASAVRAAKKKGLRPGTKAYKNFIDRYVYGAKPMQTWMAKHGKR